MIGNEDYLILQQSYLLTLLHILNGTAEQLRGFMRYQPVAYVKLIIEIQIERALCNTCTLGYLGNRRMTYSV